MSYRKYFDGRLFEEILLSNKRFRLIDIENILDENIQMISNSFRKKRTMNPGDKSWLRILYETMDKPMNNISNDENQVIELFSWMPFTVSTPDEKEKIVELLNGNKVYLSNKWINYFLGSKESNSWYRVIGDFSDYFNLRNDNSIQFNKDKIINKEAKMLLNEIQEYLLVNVNRNDKLINTWYSKAEIFFMAGKLKREINSSTNVLESDNILNTNDILLSNSLEGEVYKNEIWNDGKTFIMSNSTTKKFDLSKNYHNFIGKKLFHKNELFYYVGAPEEQIEIYDYKIKPNSKEYIRYMYKSKNILPNEIIKYLSL